MKFRSTSEEGLISFAVLDILQRQSFLTQIRTLEKYVLGVSFSLFVFGDHGGLRGHNGKTFQIAAFRVCIIGKLC
jgi:hypothetical protein